MPTTQPALIPTPQSLRRLGGAPKRFLRGATCRAYVCDPRHPQVAHAVDMLREFLLQAAGVRLLVSGFAGHELPDTAADEILLCGNGDPYAFGMLPPDVPRIAGRAPDQGYILHSAADSPVVLYATHPVGLLYATATLLQVLPPASAGLCLPNLCITDHPAFRWRGNNWSLFGEVGGWSYERGDGRAAFEKRLVRKLDLCLQHKTNLVIVDGLGWNTARSPGYAPMMRRLNRAARLRGIRLLYTGYGSGYGCPCQDGTAFRNRRSYPDGEIYSCCGSPSRHSGISRTMGTCLSNRELLKLKQRELVEFVRQVEPGAMYIHNLDESILAESAKTWVMRCDDCRRRWPNDNVLAADGLAGAMAWFYDRLADAINTVRNPQTGYDAKRDCLLMMVSPNYSDCSEDDAAWRAYWDYYTVVGRIIRNPNVIIGLREQYCNRESAEHRYMQLRRHLDQQGVALPFGTIAFTGGDGFYNNNTFIATAVLTGCFEGADMVLYANGNGYQEPQQLLNAEYCWNPTGSAFHNEELPTSRDEWWPKYVALSAGTARPPRLFGRNGFLDCACRRLYGDAAGPLIAEIHRLRGRTNIRTVSQRFDRPSVLLPVWATLMPAGRFSTFRRLGVCWRQNIDEPAWARTRLLRKACAEMAKLNGKAVRLAARAKRVCGHRKEVRDDIGWLETTLRLGAMFAELTAEYLRVMDTAYRAVSRDSTAAKRTALREIATLRRTLARVPDSLTRTAPCKPVDHLGGDVGYRQELLALLRDELHRMETTLKTGEWLPQTESTWW